MLSVVVLIVCNVLFNFSVLTMANTSSTYLFQKVMSSLSAIALFSRSCMTASARKLERGEPMGVPDICLYHVSWNRNSVHRQRFSKSRMSRLSRLVFNFQDSFLLSMRSVMVIAVAHRMDVNKETTSKDTTVSSVLILRFCIWSRNVFTLPVVYGEDLTRDESNLYRNFETW